jgi:transposase
MFKCNLTKKRHNRHENRKKQTLNTMIRAGVNDFYDNYNHAITEDLSFTIKNKRQASSVNRRLSEWCKGTLQKALEEISYRRSSSVTVVNAAYTSQVDSRYGVLLGTREGSNSSPLMGRCYKLMVMQHAILKPDWMMLRLVDS